MSQSLYTAMGGISAAQTQLNVVSNNIANLNTTGFKSSSVNFSDVFYKTVSSGTGSSATTGGTNPQQIGLGVQVSSVSKDFSTGTWVATGKTTDLMIEGGGFFSVLSPAGEVYYTRAGNFSFDSDGDLVTSSGYKVLGTNKLLSTSSSGVPVHIPQTIDTEVAANSDFYNQALSNLNNCKLTDGTFRLSVNSTNPITLNIDTETYTTMSGIAANLQSQIASASTAATALATTYGGIATAANTAKTTVDGLSDGDTIDTATHTAIYNAANNAKTAADAALAAGNITQGQYDTVNEAITNILANLPDDGDTISAAQIAAISDAEPTVNSSFTTFSTAQTALAAAYDDVTVVCNASTNGTIQFKVDGTNAKTLNFSNSSSNQSNFLSETGLASSTKSNNTYASDVLDYKVSVTQVTSASDSTKVNSYSIGDDGSIEATYANGHSLSVKVGADGNTYEFVYTTAENIIITGNNVNVDKNLAVPANFVIQLASVTNPDGLLAVGSNLYSAGPNCGNIIYSVGDSMGLGSLASGGLEASNVDLSKEFSSMILAQRAIQANSRVFSTTSDTMDVVVNMAR